MSKKLIVIVGLIILFVVFVFLKGSEDTWLCENGEWVRHGVPSASMPSKPCDK